MTIMIHLRVKCVSLISASQVLSHLRDAEVEVHAYDDFRNALQAKVRSGLKVPRPSLNY